MKTYQVRFRITSDQFQEVLSALATVGPVVIEEVKAEPNNVTPPKALTTVPRYKNRPSGNGKGPKTILAVLATGEQRVSLLKQAYAEAGLAVTGLGSALDKLREKGVIENSRQGFWRLTKGTANG
jgi:hypothetical protein